MTFVAFLKTCKIVTFPSVWNDFDHFCSHTLTAKSTFYLRLVTKTELFKPPCNCKSQWNSAIQHLQNTTLKLQFQIWMRRKRVTFTKPCACAATCITFLHDIPLSCKSQWNSGANWHVTHPWKVSFYSSPQRQGHRSRIRTLEDGWGWLRTRKQRPANTALPSDSQVKREPFATHSGIMSWWNSFQTYFKWNQSSLHNVRFPNIWIWIVAIDTPAYWFPYPSSTVECLSLIRTFPGNISAKCSGWSCCSSAFVASNTQTKTQVGLCCLGSSPYHSFNMQFLKQLVQHFPTSYQESDSIGTYSIWNCHLIPPLVILSSPLWSPVFVPAKHHLKST